MPSTRAAILPPLPCCTRCSPVVAIRSESRRPGRSLAVVAGDFEPRAKLIRKSRSCWRRSSNAGMALDAAPAHRQRGRIRRAARNRSSAPALSASLGPQRRMFSDPIPLDRSTARGHDPESAASDRPPRRESSVIPIRSSPATTCGVTDSLLVARARALPAPRAGSRQRLSCPCQGESGWDELRERRTSTRAPCRAARADNASARADRHWNWLLRPGAIIAWLSGRCNPRLAVRVRLYAPRAS